MRGHVLEPDFVFGTLEGSVTVAGVPQAGARITATRPGLQPTTEATSSDGNGHYSLRLASAPWTVRIEPIEGAACPGPSEVSVVSGQTTTKDFACTLRTGIMMGVVTLDGVPVPGVTVQIVDQQSGDVTSVETDGEGVYLTLLVTGRYAAFVTISDAMCESSPQTVDVVSNEDVTSNVTCQTIPGTIRGEVTLDGMPAAGVPVYIHGGSASGQPIVVITDGAGRYVAMVTPGARSAEADIDGAICSGPEQVTVVSGEETVADIACWAIEGVYSGTFTETSNTCSIPLAPAFTSPLAVGFTQTGAEAFIDILPGDRPQETKASGPYDPATGVASLVSPPFEDSGITFQEFWAFVIGLSGVGVTFDGTVDVSLAVGGTVVCTRTYGLGATRTGN